MKENEVLENMEKLTKRQQDILDFIKLKVQEKGYPPSVREIGQAVGLASSSTVRTFIKIRRKGYIRRDPTKPRAIEILGEDRMDTETQSVIQVPIVGKVTAGLPITAVESVEEHFPLPASIVAGADQVFMLRISGDSMIEAGIFDGDLVVVRQQQSAYNGEIVVALTEDNEATVKRFYKEKTISVYNRKTLH